MLTKKQDNNIFVDKETRYEAILWIQNLWLKRDIAFIKQFDPETVEQVEKFMKAFNDYLEAQMKELGGNGDENWYYIKDYA